MQKLPVIIISRQQVETDIQREVDNGKSQIEAALCVMGNATDGIRQARKGIEALLREAKVVENFNDKQKAKYENICQTVIEPEYQRIGHCKNIIAELSRPE